MSNQSGPLSRPYVSTMRCGSCPLKRAVEIGSERYEEAMAYLVEQAALRRDERMAFDDEVGDLRPRGYGLYVFTRWALKLLDVG